MVLQNDFIGFGISTAILSITLPFIIFMIFTVVTVMMTFIGFIIIEGTIITVASVFFFGFLGVMVMASLFIGSVFLTGYFGFSHIYDLIFPGHRIAFQLKNTKLKNIYQQKEQ